MNRYLYRISTEPASVWCRVKAKPIYIVARDKTEAEEFANSRLSDNLKIKKITKLGLQIAVEIFVGE